MYGIAQSALKKMYLQVLVEHAMACQIRHAEQTIFHKNYEKTHINVIIELCLKTRTIVYSLVPCILSK
jgi:hypothetical protein